MTEPLIGEYRQSGPNLEVWSGSEWFLYCKNTSLFLNMCASFNLSLREIFHQATVRNPYDPEEYIKQQFDIAKLPMPSVFRKEPYDFSKNRL